MTDEPDTPEEQPQGADTSEFANSPDGELPSKRGDAAAQIDATIDSDIEATASFDENSLKIGKSPTIGPYKLLQKIGEGGMGAVYMAEQTHPVRRRVALKLIKAGAASRQVITRFEAERQALAMMNHQHIAKVLDAGTTDQGSPYFVMELVNGIPITDYCDKFKLSLADRLELFVQACKAIQHAHQKGVIHRDIKPSNVLVTEQDGQPAAKVIDFGLAKALQNTQRLTEETMFTAYGQVLGTLQYMSPEQAGTNAMDVDTRSDVYSLGVLLYELLTGSPPIEKRTLKDLALDKVLVAIRELEAPRPSARLSSLGHSATDISAQRRTDPKKLGLILKGDLDWIAIKALEKDRTRRYDSPNDLADDVRRFLSGEAIAARPPSVIYRLRKVARRHRVALVTAVGFALLLLTASAVSTWLAIRATDAEEVATLKARYAKVEANNARNAEAKAETDRDRAIAAEEEMEATLARSNYFLAIARWDANRAREANELLDRVPEKYRHIEWRLAKTQFEGSDVTCYGHTGAVMTADFSPDGTRIVSGSVDGSIKLWSATSGTELRTFDGHSAAVNSVSFSPDGVHIVSGSDDRTIKLWDVESGELVRTVTGHSGHVKSASVSFDGEMILSAGSDGTVRTWDLETGRQLLELANSLGQVREGYIPSARLSNDGSFIVAATNTGGNRGVLKLWQLAPSRMGVLGPPSWFSGHTSWTDSVCISPDSKLMASAGRDNTVRLWSVGSGENLKTFLGHGGNVETVNFNPDGRQILSGGHDGTIKLWDVASGQVLQTLNGHLNVVHCAVFSPDGSRIVSTGADGTVRLWNVTTVNKRRTHRGHSESGHLVMCLPNGEVMSAGTDNSLERWNLVTGKVTQSFDGHEGRVYSFCYSPDGEVLASGGADKTIKIWNSRTREAIHTLRGHVDYVSSVAFSIDGMTLISGSGDKTVRFWDRNTGQLLRTLPAHTADVHCLRSNPNADRFVSGSNDGTIKVWSVSDGTLLKSWKGHLGWCMCVNFSTDGRTVLSSGTDGLIKAWDESTGNELRSFQGHTATIHSVAFVEHESRVVSASADGSIKVWDFSTGEELRSLVAQSGPVYSVSVNHDSTQMISSGSSDGTICLWEFGSSPEHRTIEGFSEPVEKVYFGHDSATLYVQSAQQRMICSTATGKMIEGGQWIDSDNSEPRSPDGRWLAVPLNDQVLLVDLEFKNTRKEKAYRELMGKPDPYWHEQQASLAEKSDNGFAKAFHRAWLLKLRPESRADYDSFHAVAAKLEPKLTELMPAAVSAMAIPKPPVSKEEWQVHNNLLWRKVVLPFSKPSDRDIALLKDIAAVQPQGIYYNTLGVMHYRAGNYESSIEACTKSLELTPKEMNLPCPHPGDLAFLAMSHLKLGNQDNAAEFRTQFNEAMKQDIFKQDVECLRFGHELDLEVAGKTTWTGLSERQYRAAFKDFRDYEAIAQDVYVEDDHLKFDLEMTRHSGAVWASRRGSTEQFLANHEQFVVEGFQLQCHEECMSKGERFHVALWKKVAEGAERKGPIATEVKLIDVDYAAVPDNVEDTKDDGETNGTADGVYYHKFPAGHQFAGPYVPFDHPAVGDFELKLEVRLTDILVWMGLPRHGTALESHCRDALLCPSGFQEVRDYSYERKDGSWSETRRHPIKLFPKPNTGKGDWMKLRIIRNGNEYTYMEGDQVIATTVDDNPREDDFRDLPGQIYLWLLPATDGPATFELRSLTLLKS